MRRARREPHQDASIYVPRASAPGPVVVVGIRRATIASSVLDPPQSAFLGPLRGAGRGARALARTLTGAGRAGSPTCFNNARRDEAYRPSRIRRNRGYRFTLSLPMT